MNRIDRRFFLASLPAAVMAVHPLLRAQTQDPSRVEVTLKPDEVLATVPSDMMGLSYESTQLGEPEFFMPENRNLAQLFRTLSGSGVLRLGGNTSEFTYFKAKAESTAPSYAALPTQPAALTPITVSALQNLRGFLDATNWNCIYGLNLGTGTPARAAEEAVAVARILGPRLKYFQIGNEPNNYIRYKLRPSTWNADRYIDEWLPFARALIQSVPGAKIGGPDMGAEAAWMETFARRAVPALGASLVEMTDHFYAEGPPTSPEATMAHLLFNTKIDHEISVMQSAGKQSKRPYRMTEVNSCYLGGKPGVSDTMGAALWAGDLTLRLMANGFSGINFHGGSARQIKASLGGTLPGDGVANANAADSYYTPIAGSITEGFTPRPIFYGMMLASRLAGMKLIRAQSSKDSVQVYGALENGSQALRMIVFERSGQSAELRLNVPSGYRIADCQRLEASSVTATSGIVLGGVSISREGVLPASTKSGDPRSNPASLTLAPFTAALLKLTRS